jgi:hypothetical protein
MSAAGTGRSGSTRPAGPGGRDVGSLAGDAADPGVPEGLATTIALVRRRLGADSIDRLWIFPPMTRGRRERGLVAISCFAETGRRRLLTAAYLARRRGLDLGVEPELVEQGLAPADSLPRVMNGVVRRESLQLGEPREVVIGGDAAMLNGLVAELEERVRVQGL